MGPSSVWLPFFSVQPGKKFLQKFLQEIHTGLE